MELRVLGPVELVANGRSVQVSAARQRGLLALLVVERGRTVSSEWLIDQLWPGGPPPAAKVTLQSCVYRLRKLFGSLEVATTLHTRSGGYQLDVPPGQLDLERFEQSIEAGQRELAAGRPDAAAALLRSGLGLWRGEAFEAIDVPLVRDQAGRLRERRLDAFEQCLTAELATGRHADVAGELEELVQRYPLRESLWQLRMLALTRGGRKADALEVYRQLHRLLDDELGIQPSAPVQELHRRILAGDPSLHESRAEAPAGVAEEPATVSEAGGRTTPRMLPPVIGGFTGRKAQLARLDELLPSDTGQGRPRQEAVVISALSGTAGIGKTMLAVHWAHRVADRFPDGQLYVNLRGFHPTGQPVTPAEALRGFLDALGVPTGSGGRGIPAGLDAQVGLYRSLLADRRMLIVLDNARDSQHVRPLLPGAPGCLVVVTSRNQLTSLVGVEAARPLLLDLLTTDEARELLARRLGQDRVDAEPQAVADLIEACARLPLALVIVAARAATHPGFSLRALADELTAAGNGLDAFTDSDPGDTTADVRTVFSWSYHQLSPAAAQLFRLLGHHRGPDISLAAAASLAGVPLARVRSLLGELTQAHLLTQHRPGRYTFHDLLRAYAGELARTDSPDAQRAATYRMLDHYLHTAHAADRMLNPSREPISPLPVHVGTQPESFADAGQALGWFTTEHQVLLAAITAADGGGFETHAWQLAWTMVDYLDRHGHWEDWVAAQSTALAAAERAGDRPAQARAHDSLIRPYIRLGRLLLAYDHAQRSLLAYTEVGDAAGRARAQHKIGWVLGTMGRTREGLEHMRQSLNLYRRISHSAGEADALSGLGWLLAELGDYQLAVGYLRQSIEWGAASGHLYGGASSWELLGRVLHLTGDHLEAGDCFRQALSLYEQLGDRHNQAGMLQRLGETERARGDEVAASEHLRQAQAILAELGA
ncbi:AfsR/SARP family transcriptional regulator [Flindersiella endophytica]